MSTIAKPFGWLMLFLYNTVGSYGLALILFALLVRLILLPFTMKSKKGMMSMTRFQPKLKELEKRYEGNKQKYQEEVAKLYKEEGVNPMGGCIWSLIPFPILIALYYAIRFPITVMMGVGAEGYSAITVLLEKLGFEAASGAQSGYVEIFQSQFITEHFSEFSALGIDKLQTLDYSFLGIDLGAVPSWRFWEFSSANGSMWSQIALFLIPLISAALSYVSVLISNKMNGNSSEQSGMKGMTLMMPLVSIWIGFVMPGALGLYWIASSFFTIIQDVILTRHYKKILDAEDAVRREKEAALEAERAAKRLETEKLRAEGATTVNPNTSRRKISQKEKQKAVEREQKWEESTGKTKKADAANPSAVGDRPYARGRNYKPDRFSKNYVPDAEEVFSAEETVLADQTAAEAPVMLPETQESSAPAEISAEENAGAAEEAVLPEAQPSEPAEAAQESEINKEDAL
jgi:YidC/Oxa1 family membrane protein insertase